MEKDKNNSTRRNLLDSFVRRSLLAGARFVDNQKTSLGMFLNSKAERKRKDKSHQENSHNRSTQLATTTTKNKFSSHPCKKSFQDLISKSVTNGSMVVEDACLSSPVYKSEPKVVESVFGHSVYKMGYSPKSSFAFGGFIKPISKLKSDSLVLVGSPKTRNSPVHEHSSKRDQRKSVTKSKQVCKTFQDFLEVSSKKTKGQKDDKEDGMSTTRPISVEEIKTAKAKQPNEKIRLSAKGISGGLPLAKKKEFRMTDFGQQPSNIVIDIPKKYRRIGSFKEGWLDFKSNGVSSVNSKQDILRLSSLEKEISKKEVSLSIRGRVNVVKETPLFSFKNNIKTSVFFPAESIKENKVNNKEMKCQKFMRRPQTRKSSGVEIVDQLFQSLKNCQLDTRENFMVETPNKSIYMKALEAQRLSWATCDANQHSLEQSFYKIILDRQLGHKRLSSSVSNFINSMGKSLMDFYNKFPQGPPVPVRKVNLPKRSPNSKPDSSIEKYTLIFDLDETLVHYNVMPVTVESTVHTFGNIKLCMNPSSSKVVKVGRPDQGSILLRPHAKQVLTELAEKFEILVFTSSCKDYAKEVLKKLDPKSTLISFLLHREHCFVQKDLAVKDLRIIQNRSLDTVLIIDNCASAFGTQLGNGIPILPFQGDQSDSELLHLRTYLYKLADRETNLVETNRQVFSLEKLRQCKESMQYVQHLQACADLHRWLSDSGGSPTSSPSNSESS